MSRISGAKRALGAFGAGAQAARAWLFARFCWRALGLTGRQNASASLASLNSAPAEGASGQREKYALTWPWVLWRFVFWATMNVWLVLMLIDVVTMEKVYMNKTVVGLGLVAIGVFAMVAASRRNTLADARGWYPAAKPRDGEIQVTVTDVPGVGDVRVYLYRGTARVEHAGGVMMQPDTRARVQRLALLAAAIPAPRISWHAEEPGAGV